MRPVRYALWSLLVIAPAFLILSAFGGTYADLREPIGPDTGLMTVMATAIALAVSALIAPGIVRSDAPGLPGWAAGLALAAALQLPAAVLMGIGGPPTSLWNGAYVPGALVCLNILTLIFLHVWVAAVGMGRSPAVGLVTGGAYGAWVFRVGSAQEFDAFMAISSVGAILAMTAAIVAAFVGSAYGQTAPVKDSPGRA